LSVDADAHRAREICGHRSVTGHAHAAWIALAGAGPKPLAESRTRGCCRGELHERALRVFVETGRAAVDAAVGGGDGACPMSLSAEERIVRQVLAGFVVAAVVGPAHVLAPLDWAVGTCALEVIHEYGLALASVG